MERYNLTREDFVQVESQIRKHLTDNTCDTVKYVTSDRQYEDRDIYTVKLRDFVVPVVWCKTTKCPVTFLPPEYLKTIPADWVPESFRACSDLITELGRKMSVISRKISTSPKGSSERLGLQSEYQEMVAELNRLKFLRDTQYEVNQELRDHIHEPVTLIAKLSSLLKDVLAESGLQAEEGSALRFVLSAAKDYLKENAR